MGSRDERAAGDRHVVAHDRDLVADLACDLRDLGPLVLGPHLVHDREARLDHLRETDGVLGAAGVGCHRDDAFPGEPEVAEVRCEQLQRSHVIDGDREKALDLAGVEVERHHPVGAGAGDQVRHQLGRDRRARAGFAVLTGIAEIRNDGGDAPPRRAAQRIDDDEQFHQVVVSRKRRRLNDENVAAADVFLDLDEDFHVGEAPHHRLGQRRREIGGDGIGERGIGVAGDELDCSIIGPHRCLLARCLIGSARPRRPDNKEAARLAI
jgi:hypothetical protein